MGNDLISRSALLEVLRKSHSFHTKTSRDCSLLSRDVRLVKEAHAVDAVEVGNCDGCYWKQIGRQQKCSCCRRNRDMKDCYRRADDG